MLFSNFTFTQTVEGHSSSRSVALPIWFMLPGFSPPYVRTGTKAMEEGGSLACPLWFQLSQPSHTTQGLLPPPT